MEILIINGPNLNLLGDREASIYGSESFDVLFEKFKREFPDVELSYFQSNIEGEIIDALHQGRKKDGIIINPAAYTHSSVAIGDAIRGIEVPVIEVHMSNVYSREDFRHVSFVSPAAIGTICGFGADSYRLALAQLSRIKN